MNLAVERMFENNDWMAVVLLLVFVLVSLLKVLYPKRLESLLGCLFSKRYFLDYSSELLELFGMFNAILFLIQNIILSLFGFWILQNIEYIQNDFVSYVSVFIGVNAYFIFQYIIGKTIAVLFGYSEQFEINRVLKFNYMKSICLLFIPVLISLIYAFPNSSFMLGFSVVLMLLLFVFRLVLILVSNIKQFSYNWFYFILYICTLEILPIIFLYLLALK
jgi:hypothetical protein